MPAYRWSGAVICILTLLPAAMVWSKSAPSALEYGCVSYQTLYQVLLDQAQEGNDVAQFRLAQMYMKGQGVARDFGQAFYWYRLAAHQGHADAQFSLAVLYSNGKGVDTDLQRAFLWFSLARQQGVTQGDSDLKYIRRVLSSEQLAEASRMLKQHEVIISPPAPETESIGR